VAAATYLAARLVGTWELYLVSFGFLAALLVSWLLVAMTSRKLTATRTLSPSEPTSGDDLVVTFRVTSDSQIPGLQVTLPNATGDLGARDETIEFASLGSLQQRAARSTPQPARRGVHHLPALWAQAEDPLGLVRTRRRLGEPLDLTVYPKLVELRSCALFADLGTRRGLGRRGVVRGASEFRGIRPHNPGEPLSRIDWKSTAKTGNLMLREMDDPASGDLTVLLDATASQVVGDEPQTNFELAVQAAGSVADFLLGAGRSVNLLLHDGRERTTRLAPGFNGHHRLLDVLAQATPSARAPLASSLQSLRSHGGRLASTQILVLVVLSLDRELARVLIALRREGLQVSVAYVGAGSFGAEAPGAPSAGAPSARGSTASGTAGARPAGARPADDPALLVSLAAAGVLCLTLRRDDDLRTVLSFTPTERSLAMGPH
jgi:uncharacterized protein (DUF58 family)